MVGIGEQGRGGGGGQRKKGKRVRARMKSVVLVPKSKAVTMIWLLKL